MNFHDFVPARRVIEDIVLRACDLMEANPNGLDTGSIQRLSGELIECAMYRVLMDAGIRQARGTHTEDWNVWAALRLTEYEEAHLNPMTTKLRGEAETHRLTALYLTCFAAREALFSDSQWRMRNRPYFHVYPIIYDILKTIPLDLPWSHLPVACGGALVFNFGYGAEPFGITSALITDTGESAEPNADLASRARIIRFRVQTTNSRKNSREFICFAYSYNIVEDQVFGDVHLAHQSAEWVVNAKDQVENSLHRFRPSTQYAIEATTTFLQERRDAVQFLMRLYAFAGLANGTGSLFTPLVLAKYRSQFESSDDEALRASLIEKSQRVLGRGYALGKTLTDDEQAGHRDAVANSGRAVHWRRKHYMLAWTGEGRAVPRIVERRGSLIGLEAATSAPTGFLGLESKEELHRLFSTAPADCEWVYILQDGDRPWVKIGRAEKSPEKRLKALQTGNPELRLLGIIPTGDCVALEKQLHAEHAARHSKGEFYYLGLDECRELVSRCGGKWTAS